MGTIVATRQAVIARQERAIAIELQHHAERQTYRARIAAAATAVETHDTVLARSNLEAAPVEMRGWEWRHFQSRLDQSSLAIDVETSRHTELRFESDDTQLVVLDWSSVPWVVFSIDLAGDAVPGERFSVGMSRPYRVPAEAGWQATRSVYFVRGESTVELTDPSGNRRRLLRRCDDDTRGIGSRALTADGRSALFSANTSARSEVHLCDLETGKGGPVFRIPYGWAFAMSADGSVLAVSPKTEDRGTNRVDLFSTADGVQIGEFPVPLDDLTALDLSHDGGFLAAGSYNGVLRVWNVETGQLLSERRAHNGQFVGVVRFSQDGARIASGSSDRTVHLWPSDLSGEPVVLHGHADNIEDVRFSQGGKRLASVDRRWLDPPVESRREPRRARGAERPRQLRESGALFARRPADRLGLLGPDGQTVGCGSRESRFGHSTSGPGSTQEFGVEGLAIDPSPAPGSPPARHTPASSSTTC